MKYAMLSLILLAGAGHAQDTKVDKSYICLADKATGFVFNQRTKTWEQNNFGVEDSKYIVRPTSENDSARAKHHEYAVWQHGEDTPVSYCREGFTGSSGRLYCREGGTEFRFNAHSKRFMVSFWGSYITATIDTDDDYRFVGLKTDEGGDTPYMEIGKCSALN